MQFTIFHKLFSEKMLCVQAWNFCTRIFRFWEKYARILCIPKIACGSKPCRYNLFIRRKKRPLEKSKMPSKNREKRIEMLAYI